MRRRSWHADCASRGRRSWQINQWASEGVPAMQEDRFAPIREGMTVEDADGDKVGTVGKIYQPASVTSTASSTTEPAGELFLKVDTGFLGLGKDQFIPASAIRDVT